MAFSNSMHTDANGNPIDIDITNGTRLLINGRMLRKVLIMLEPYQQHWDLFQPSALIPKTYMWIRSWNS